MAKKKTFEMVEIGGKLVCPKCKERNFKPLDEGRCVKDYDVSPASKRDLGLYMFVYICANCKAELVEYVDM